MSDRQCKSAYTNKVLHRNQRSKITTKQHTLIVQIFVKKIRIFRRYYFCGTRNLSELVCLKLLIECRSMLKVSLAIPRCGINIVHSDLNSIM